MAVMVLTGGGWLHRRHSRSVLLASIATFNRQLGRQRGAKVARIDIARQLAEAIWHVLTKNEPFAPASPAILLVA